ncbi:MAG: hypothetical protein IPN86_22350 [Saprospiraceae bacterium]|nr:hypothetical protein [Saprospiraceae bacterium]
MSFRRSFSVRCRREKLIPYQFLCGNTNFAYHLSNLSYNCERRIANDEMTNAERRIASDEMTNAERRVTNDELRATKCE